MSAEIPAAAAAVAAPIQKLWPEYTWSSTPAARRADLTLFTDDSL